MPLPKHDLGSTTAAKTGLSLNWSDFIMTRLIKMPYFSH